MSAEFAEGNQRWYLNVKKTSDLPTFELMYGGGHNWKIIIGDRSFGGNSGLSYYVTDDYCHRCFLLIKDFAFGSSACFHVYDNDQRCFAIDGMRGATTLWINTKAMAEKKNCSTFQFLPAKSRLTFSS